MRKKVSILIICITCLSAVLNGQNLHFSQFYLPDYITNPALTGRIFEDIRVNIIHRSQWYNTGSNISTSGFGYDMNFEGGKLGDTKLGVGASFLNDILIQDFLENKKFSLATAWHIPLDGVKRNQLSLGVQGTLQQLYIAGPENYLWGSEFDSFNRPNELPVDLVGEDFTGGNKSTFSLNAGAVYSHKFSKKAGILVSSALYHINKPNSSIYGSVAKSDTSNLNWAYLNMVKSQFLLSPRFLLQPAVFYLNHENAQSAIAGSFFTLIPNPDNHFLKFSIGTWYRFGAQKTQNLSNAFILSSLIELHNFKIGMSYDFNVSSLNQVTAIPDVVANRVGTFEVSITYLGQLLRANPKDLTVPCKFF